MAPPIQTARRKTEGEAILASEELFLKKKNSLGLKSLLFYRIYLITFPPFIFLLFFFSIEMRLTNSLLLNQIKQSNVPKFLYISNYLHFLENNVSKHF